MLVLDNALFYHSDQIEKMYLEAGVKLVYLPLYFLDLSPIKEFFAELKAYIPRHW
jgi:transposase